MNKNKFHTQKLVYSLLGLFCFSMVLTSCDKGFDAINTNKNQINSIPPELVLNNQIQGVAGSGAYGNLLYESAIVQQNVAPFGQTLAGGNFNQDNQTPWVANQWSYGSIRQLVDTIERTRGEERYHNTHQMARIIRAVVGLKLTDTMGDVPFEDAGYGYLENDEAHLYPKYDRQADIYRTALSEIAEATTALDAGRSTPNDVLYSGNIALWKKFGNSLLLRYGMRLSDVEPATAEQYVNAAFNGGVFQSNDDNAMLIRNTDYQMSMSGTFTGGERANFYLTDVFVDYLQDTNDPRLESIAVRYVGADGQAAQDAEVGKTTAAGDQIGMPMGYDQGTIANAVTADGLGSYFEYSQVDRDRMVSQTAPDFIVTYAQTQLLLAEAAERGWISGSGIDYYADGVRGALEQMAIHHPDMAIPQSEINTFVAERQAAYASGNAMEEIHNQYWVAGFIITPKEVFANWRRTDYPVLEPVDYEGGQDITPSSEGGIGFMLRRPYPLGEFNDNPDNIQKAIDNQGWDRSNRDGNGYDEQVWWDVHLPGRHR